MTTKQLAQAEKLLLEAKPHLFAITSDYQPAMRNGDAWLAIAWTGDAKQLHRDIPEITYVIGKEGGEIWTDFYAVPKGAPHREAGYALINFLLIPTINAKEVHVRTAIRRRTSGPSTLLPPEMLKDPIMYPGGGRADAAGVRRGGDADRSRPGRDHGALQIGLTAGRVPASIVTAEAAGEK